MLGIPRPLGGLAYLTRAGIAFMWRRRPLRIALIAVLLAMPLLGGGWWLARHSSLTAVERVHVSGLAAATGADTAAIETALSGAARGMSTLGVNPTVLRAAVAQYPIVRSVRTRTLFPHGLRIEVVEQPPVATLVENGARTAVAADGVVLGPGYLSSALPLVNATATGAATGSAIATGNAAGTATGTATAAGTATTTGTATGEAGITLPATGHSVRGASLLGALSVLGAAPAALERTVTRVYFGPRGLTIVLRSGLLAYFGDATRAHAKWIALTRVLADPSSVGAAYIDVRLPERPAAGWAPGAAHPETSSLSESASSTSGSDPATAAELAAGLDAAVEGGSGTASTGAKPPANRAPLANRARPANPLPPARTSPGKRPRDPNSRPQVDGIGEGDLEVESRVPGSATIVARLVDIVDRVKFPA